jgi:hypothetical protein
MVFLESNHINMNLIEAHAALNQAQAFLYFQGAIRNEPDMAGILFSNAAIGRRAFLYINDHSTDGVVKLKFFISDESSLRIEFLTPDDKFIVSITEIYCTQSTKQILIDTAATNPGAAAGVGLAIFVIENDRQIIVPVSKRSIVLNMKEYTVVEV